MGIENGLTPEQMGLNPNETEIKPDQPKISSEDRGEHGRCRHGNIPVDCAKCKLSEREAHDEANALRSATGQGTTGTKLGWMNELKQRNPSDPVEYSATAKDYTRAEKKLDFANGPLKEAKETGLGGVIYGALLRGARYIFPTKGLEVPGHMNYSVGDSIKTSVEMKKRGKKFAKDELAKAEKEEDNLQ